MDPVKLALSKEVDWAAMKLDAGADMDNLLNFAKKTPERILKMWRLNFQVQEDHLTTKVNYDRPKEDFTQEETQQIIKEIHDKKQKYFEAAKKRVNEFKSKANTMARSSSVG